MVELARIPLAGGGAVLVECAGPEDDGPVKAGRLGDRVRDVSTTLQDLLQPVTDTAQILLDQLSRARPAELEVEFGVALSAQAGAIITQTALNSNIKVKMRWRRDGLDEQVREEQAEQDTPDCP
ncbi:CU044_2847 family protein [Actinoplanes teichomyceticus]|uniref:Trypsin-co-occurring domain-containing protein n=1 Tax=Actinoplanes teichomyceticus TaxID=1867 RepID=A0A561VMX8_ACTTI|nr:CU044_2847 family protein [Actinoplanes teichomyceticus]TWG12965.1 hypothetical protein FHX34_105833 [Actinoplanes teichomyceticus]GIF16977.1 hypothetical protein Ate01nite_70090 [Actinoplanes teichomyceticus]